jgi:DNA-binding transcriptional LysR family regulator
VELHLQIITLGGENSEYAGIYRFGVTEIVALTWLPDLVADIRTTYPRLVLEPQVDLALSLISRLEARELDMVIAPELPRFSTFEREFLGELECAWFCSPKLLPNDHALSSDSLAQFPVLAHADGSAVSELLRRDLEDLGVREVRSLTSNNTLALAHLAKAGLGITYLPTEYFRPDIESGALTRMTSMPGTTSLRYVAAFRSDIDGSLNRRIAKMAKQNFRA